MSLAANIRREYTRQCETALSTRPPGRRFIALRALVSALRASVRSFISIRQVAPHDLDLA